MKKNNYTPSALILGLLCLGLTACSKDDGDNQSPISYPLTVKATALEEQGPVKLYTKDGEVTDEAVIAKFIADAEYFNATFTPGENSTITFITDTTAKLGEADYIYTIEKQSEGLFTFNKKTLVETVPGSRIYEPDAYNMCKYRGPLVPVRKEGTHQIFEGTSKIPASGTYASFRFPVLSYKMHRIDRTENGFAQGFISGTVKNELDEAFLSTLVQEDTLAVQQSWVKYKE